ncbi:hypothetical protein [Paragemmobacter ruber]|uniref:Uncharacterized protein n=1 Tax=Paragemmobacter ruber TaxID=1985673 RepID=A0ABW9Y9G1_9RHOB|nr:hypothetical protein [Rhodobacter ruber]NBE09158.1 hypothetical protein [Rhodobacter ruber]
MSHEPDHKEMQAMAQGVVVPGMAVECVVFDHADRPKRRHLLPLAGLLAPLSGKVSGLAADAS